MARKVVRVRTRPRFDATGNMDEPPGEVVADDGTPVDGIRWDLAVTDGDPDPEAQYTVAAELTQPVFAADGSAAHQPGEQYADGSAMTPDVRWRDVILPAGSSLPGWAG